MPCKAVLLAAGVGFGHYLQEHWQQFSDARLRLGRILQIFAQLVHVQRSVLIIAAAIKIDIANHTCAGAVCAEQVVHRGEVVAFQIHRVCGNGVRHLHGGFHIHKGLRSRHAAKEGDVQRDGAGSGIFHKA